MGQALALDDSQSHLWDLKAVTLTRLSGPEAALACASRAVELAPTSSKAIQTKVQLLGLLGRLTDAIMCLDQAIAVDDSKSLFWRLRGGAGRDPGSIRRSPRRLAARHRTGTGVWGGVVRYGEGTDQGISTV